MPAARGCLRAARLPIAVRGSRASAFCETNGTTAEYAGLLEHMTSGRLAYGDSSWTSQPLGWTGQAAQTKKIDFKL
jgi:hypothetical protein